MKILDKIEAYGHNNILCTHKTTIEITKDKTLSLRGNCILGVNASKACADLSPKLKDLIKKEKKVYVIIQINQKLKDTFYGYGHRKLTLKNNKDMVFRKSDYICDRTILINCSKSAKDLNRKIINKLKDPLTKLTIIFKA
ncbi:MAG: DUF371 domain-containing protein [Promethearchaeia archaeon]